VAYVLVRTLPTLNEYFTIQRAVDKIAKQQPATVAEARGAFRQAEGPGIFDQFHHRQGPDPSPRKTTRW
jgi:hypothetical protein